MGGFVADLTSRLTDTLMADGPASPTPAAASPAVEQTPAPSPESAPVTETTVTEIPASGLEGVQAQEDPEDFSFSDEAPKSVADAPTADADKRDWSKLLPKEVEAQFLKTQRGTRMLESFKRDRELEKLPSEGGLGYIPTAEQIKESAGLASSMHDMARDFHSGNPENAKNFINQWFLRGANGQASAGAQVVAQNFLPTLIEQANGGSEAAAALYREAARPAVLRYVEEAYDRADSMQDPELRTIWFNVARMIEKDITGKFRPISEEQLAGTAPVQQGPDPREAEIDRKLHVVQSFEQRQAQQREQQFGQTIKTAIQTALMSDIREALKPILDQYPTTISNDLVEKFHDKVVAEVRQNPANLDAFKRAAEVARRDPSQANIQNAARAWATVARQVIRSKRGAYINDALKPRVEESQKRHDVLAEASQKRGTTSMAQPVGKDLSVGANKPKAGQSFEEFLREKTSALIAS